MPTLKARKSKPQVRKMKKELEAGAVSGAETEWSMRVLENRYILQG